MFIEYRPMLGTARRVLSIGAGYCGHRFLVMELATEDLFVHDGTCNNIL